MFIQFLEDTNIRFKPELTDDTLVGQVYSGQFLTVENSLHVGAAIEGNNRWYRDANGWFYWSGKVAEINKSDSEEPPPVTDPSLGSLGDGTQAASTVSMLHESDLMEGLNDLSADGIPDGESRAVHPPPAKTVANTPNAGFESTRDRNNEPDNRANIALAQEVHAASPPPTSTVLTSSFEGTQVIQTTTTETSVAQISGFESTISREPTPPPSAARSIAPPPPDSFLTPTAELPWGIDQHQIPTAWWVNQKATGQGIRIALLSTGIDAECPDITDAIADGYIVRGLGDEITDTHGMGTQAAVLIAGRGPRLLGIAPDAHLLPVKIGEIDSLITPEALIEGLDWAINMEADIIAMLVDFPSLDAATLAAVQQKINAALAKNILLVAPVGNSTDRRPVLRYPAAFEGVLSVGAHDSFGHRSFFSAKSTRLDVLAPGEGLRSAGLQQQIQPANFQSTSIAAAFAAGALALLRQTERDKGTLSAPADLIGLLRDMAIAPKSHVAKGEDVEYGYGLLQLSTEKP
jgi:Subtilase family